MEQGWARWIKRVNPQRNHCVVKFAMRVKSHLWCGEILALQGWKIRITIKENLWKTVG